MTTVYVGPYLVLPPSPVKRISHQRVCSNHCGAPAFNAPAKFCANCGGAVLDVDVPVEEIKPLPIQMLADRWTDYMFRPEYGQHHAKGDIWLPNRGRHGLSLERGSEDSFKPVSLASLDGAEMLDKAQRAYEKFVEALKKDFGVKPFWEVGIVAYSA